MLDMEFKKIKCVQAFYDKHCGTVFYVFETIPQIGHGDWAISEGGDVAYDLRSDNITQVDFPNELLDLLSYIPNDIDIEGLDMMD